MNKMKTLYYLKKYYRELVEAINRYDDLIQCEMKSLDIIIGKQEVFNCLGITALSIINYRIQRDSTIDNIIESIQDYESIRKAKENKAKLIYNRIQEIEQYMTERRFL